MTDVDRSADEMPEQPVSEKRATRPPWVGRATAPMQAPHPSPERPPRQPATGDLPRAGSLDVQAGSARGRRPLVWLWAMIAVAALLLALFSLAINGLLIQRLAATRDAGREMIDAAIAGVDEATLGDMTFSYVFSDTIVYSGTVPISQTIQFPFQGRVPFQGNVPYRGSVPIVVNVPVLGVQRFSIPVNTSIYVDTSVDVSTTVTVPVQMAFPFEVEMPVELPIDIAISLDDQPPLRDLLANLRSFLVELRAGLLE